MLEVRNLSGRIGRVSVEEASFLVEEGDFLGIFGPDDSGKSEILFWIMGLAEADSGEVLYQGEPVIRKGLRSVRYVPDNVLMESGITALKYMKQFARVYKIQDMAVLNELAADFGISLSEKVMAMTYEENKLVTIIAALLTKPDLLILDEPFNFLTEETGIKLMELLTEQNQQGMTIIITAEESRMIRGYVNKFLYLKAGRIIGQGDRASMPENIKAVRIRWDNTSAEYAGKVEEVLGKPVSESGMESVYLCENCQGKLMRLINQCGVSENDILIGRMELEDILEEEGGRHDT